VNSKCAKVLLQQSPKVPFQDCFWPTRPQLEQLLKNAP